MKAFRAHRAQRRNDQFALASYRSHIPLLRRWLADMPDVCALLDQLAYEAGDKGIDASLRCCGPGELRDRLRDARRAQHRAAHEKTLRDALSHLRVLAREIDGVDPKWADERRRASLTGGSLTLGELRAAKRFLDRIDLERITAREKTTKGEKA
jgi:hypothetical protein